MVLPSWIIFEELERQRKEREEMERPRAEMPCPPPWEPAPEATPEQPAPRVIVIEL